MFDISMELSTTQDGSVLLLGRNNILNETAYNPIQLNIGNHLIMLLRIKCFINNIENN